MRLRQLESHLQAVRAFSVPKAELEQYGTTPHLAAQLGRMLVDNDDVEGKVLCDLGCGAGMLSIAAAMVGASQVVGVDIDEDALSTARENVVEYDMEDTVDLLRMDVCDMTLMKRFDTVVMNPPFGTKRHGIDMQFLFTAINLAKHTVYSMHKTTTRDFIQKRFRDFGVDAEVSDGAWARNNWTAKTDSNGVAQVVAEMNFDIGRTYGFQKRKDMDIAVDLWRFDVHKARVIETHEIPIAIAPSVEHIAISDTSVYNVKKRQVERRRRRRR